MLFAKEKSRCNINQSIVVSSENGKCHRAINKDVDQVFQFKVDGDIISSSSGEQRCDYILENQTKMHAYLIELKGSDINHAIDQIRATHRKLKNILSNYEIYPRIVCRSNTHAIRGSKVRTFKNEYINTIIKNNSIEESI